MITPGTLLKRFIQGMKEEMKMQPLLGSHNEWKPSDRKKLMEFGLGIHDALKITEDRELVKSLRADLP